MFPASSNPSSGANQSSSLSVPTNTWQGMCLNCNSQPQAQDVATGLYHPFCSHACAVGNPLLSPPPGPNLVGNPNVNTSVNLGANTDPTLDMCNHCMQRPKHTNGITTHPYCGKTCAALAKGTALAMTNTPTPITRARTASTMNPFTTNPTQLTPPSNLPNHLRHTVSVGGRGKTPSLKHHPGSFIWPGSANPTNNRSSLFFGGTTGQTCQTPGCTSPVYVSPDGALGKYCSKTHKELGKNGCIWCRKVQTNGSVIFCQPCYTSLLRTAPMIIEVPQDHERYKSVQSQFQQKWLHSANCPQVRAIYKIIGTAASMARYDKYLDQVETQRNFASRNRPRGNENRRWHGTTRKCNIGDKGVTTFCSDSKCALCCIMKSSFDLAFFARRTSFGRFGAGIYTSSTSSKADSYSSNKCTSKLKATLLNKVVVGKGYKMTVDNTALTGPPAGYDSVLGEVGARLNYDEVVVYHNDAIRPSYLVMYDIPS